MKLIRTLLLLAACCAAAVQTQAVQGRPGGRGPAKPAGSEPRLQLTTSVVAQNYLCATRVGFKLRFEFKNTGAVPVILDKRSFMVRQMVSRDPEAAAAGQYEEVGVAEDFGGGARAFDDPSDMTNFVVLAAGEVYAFETGIGSFSVRDGDRESNNGYLNAGTHYMQVKVGTWSYTTDPKPFSRKWSGKGFLWSAGLTSEPMPFTVAKSDQSPACR